MLTSYIALHFDDNPSGGFVKDEGEPAYNRIYPDGRPSKTSAYMGLHPDSDPSESLLKDGGSPTLDARSQPIMGYTLMAVRAGQHPIHVFILMATFRGAS